jgi:hypothetical protein
LVNRRTFRGVLLFYRRNHLTVVFANDIRSVILKLAEEYGTERTFGPTDVARAVDQKNWKILLEQVKLVAGSLIHEGKITAHVRARSLMQII